MVSRSTHDLADKSTSSNYFVTVMLPDALFGALILLSHLSSSVFPTEAAAREQGGVRGLLDTETSVSR